MRDRLLQRRQPKLIDPLVRQFMLVIARGAVERRGIGEDRDALEAPRAAVRLADVEGVRADAEDRIAHLAVMGFLVDTGRAKNIDEVEIVAEMPVEVTANLRVQPPLFGAA